MNIFFKKFFYEHFENKKEPATDEILKTMEDIRQLINKVDRRILVGHFPIYLIRMPKWLQRMILIFGFYEPVNKEVYISTYYPVGSYRFYSNLTHETLHYLHRCFGRGSFFKTEYEEAMNRILTHWTIEKGERFPNKIDDLGNTIDVLKEIQKEWICAMNVTTAILSENRIPMEDVFYAYYARDEEFFREIFPDYFFESI